MFLQEVVAALHHVHQRGYLHNDIKMNNILLGKTCIGTISAYLTDFGKACRQKDAQLYRLTDKEIEVHKVKHTHVAPDLRDGLVTQRRETDIFSLGRVFHRLCSKHSLLGSLNETIKACLSYHSHDRPQLSVIVKALHQVKE